MSEYEARGAETTEYNETESEDAAARAPAPATPVMQRFRDLNKEQMLAWFVLGLAFPIVPHVIYQLACILLRALWSLVWLMFSVWVPMSVIGLLIGVIIQ